MSTWAKTCGLAASLLLTFGAVGCATTDVDDGTSRFTAEPGNETTMEQSTATGDGLDSTGAGTDGDGAPAGACSTLEAMNASIAEACATCICQNAPDVAATCSATADNMCWNLVACAGANCPDPATRAACAPQSCFDFIGASGAAAPIGMVVADSCAVECSGDTGAGDVDGANGETETGGGDGDSPGASTGENPGASTGTVNIGTCNTADALTASVPIACSSCICQADPTAGGICAGARDNDCWKLVACTANACPGLTGEARNACASENCPSLVTNGATGAVGVGAVIDASCSAACGQGGDTGGPGSGMPIDVGGGDTGGGDVGGGDTGQPTTPSNPVDNTPVAECSTAEAVSARVPEACAACICDADATVAANCSGVAENACWGMVQCARELCSDVAPSERSGCALDNCGDYLGGAITASTVSPVIDASCTAVCRDSSAGNPDPGAGSGGACSTAEARAASVRPACARCLCEADANAATFCSEMPENACWNYLVCLQDNCPDDGACGSSACSEYSRGRLRANPVARLAANSCPVECAP